MDFFFDTDHVDFLSSRFGLLLASETFTDTESLNESEAPFPLMYTIAPEVTAGTS